MGRVLLDIGRRYINWKYNTILHTPAPQAREEIGHFAGIYPIERVYIRVNRLFE